MYLPISSALEHNSNSLQWHRASSLATKASALTTSNIFYSSSDETKRASAIRSCSTKSLPQDSSLQMNGEFKGGFKCVSKQQTQEHK
jgi:hypothetical protein